MRLRKVDHELLSVMEKMDGIYDLLDPKQKKAWSSFLSRVAADGMKKVQSSNSYPVRDAITVIREALGTRYCPPAGKPGVAYYAALQGTISRSGLTADLCQRAAKTALKEWGGRIKADSVIRQADKLLAEAADDCDCEKFETCVVCASPKKQKTYGEDDIDDL